MGFSLESTIIIPLILIFLLFFVALVIGLNEGMLASTVICEKNIRDKTYPYTGIKKPDPSAVLETSDLVIDIYGNLMGRLGDFKEVLGALK